MLHTCLIIDRQTKQRINKSNDTMRFCTLIIY